MKPSAAKSDNTVYKRVLEHLTRIYPDMDNPVLCSEILALFEISDSARLGHNQVDSLLWDETDIALITYGDTIQKKNEAPLQTLEQFLNRHLKDQVSVVHILPFFPYSSDDGFSVMDYYRVNPALGEWSDVRRISDQYRLMGDLVINHASSRSNWFENFKKGVDPGKDYFLTVEPECDISYVVRPRTSPLLREVMTADGLKTVWCTFSHDQIDLNFQNPKVLVEFFNILKTYVDQGVRWFRMDAVAFLWKESCTTCLHLEQTHEIIKLIRTVLSTVDPTIVIITETNVPSRENLSYLGKGDEAHMVYNFPLPPFLLYSLISQDSSKMTCWLSDLPQLPEGTAYFNFIASHDGIGLRPVEEHLTQGDIQIMIDAMIASGGRISTRALNDETANPYEINISLWDACKGFDGRPDQFQPEQFQIERFICIHAVMLALKGVPAFYIHSMLGTENDYDRREHLQSNRAVNRHIWDAERIEDLLKDQTSHHRQVLNRLSELIGVRKKHGAFHPDAGQTVLDLDRRLVAFKRYAGTEIITCIHNISPDPIRLDKVDERRILAGQIETSEGESILPTYQFLWYTES